MSSISSTSSFRVNILMVDDSADKLLAMESVLDSLGQNLVRASSGEEALRLLLKGEFALILLDVNMPGMDGFETAKIIRQRKSLELIPIIFVTALSMTDADVFKGYAFGAVDYILTPIVPEILKTKVGVFVELWKQRRELEVRAEALKEANERVELRAQQLSQANKELESFCYTIAHDLRAPLRAMEGLTAVLMEDYAEKLDDSAREYGRRMRDAAERMDQMIQDLLAYSRLALVEFTPKSVRLSGVVKDAIAQVAWDLEQKNAIILADNADGKVIGNYSMLVQVLANLISNAAKFVSPGVQPVISISAVCEGAVARIVVQDNGIGIAAEHQRRIFKLFERLHDREQFSGTGIGLSIVEKALYRMNGTIQLESELGKGTRVCIELPRDISLDRTDESGAAQDNLQFKIPEEV